MSCRSATIYFRTLYSVQKAHADGSLDTDNEARNEVKISGDFVKMQQNNSVSFAKKAAGKKIKYFYFWTVGVSGCDNPRINGDENPLIYTWILRVLVNTLLRVRHKDADYGHYQHLGSSSRNCHIN